MFRFIPAAAVLGTVLALLPSANLQGQIQAHARLDGEYLPITTFNNAFPEVLKGGKLRRASEAAYVVRPHSEFAPGFVEIRDVQVDLDPLRNASVKERTDPSAVRFRYQAAISADRALARCYALLTFVSQGSISTRLIELKSLAPGKPRTVKLEFSNQVDAVGSLHVFADGLELRTTQHPATYDVKAEHARLVGTGAGLSAAALVKLAKVYPHELSADGRYLATFRDRDAKKMLIVYDLHDLKVLAERAVTEADDVVSYLTWISPHEIAYIASVDTRRGEEYTLRIFDHRSGDDRVLDRDVYAIVSTIPRQPDVLLLIGGREGAGFYKYNVRTRTSYDFESPEAGEYRFDRDGNARVRVSLKADRRVYFCRATPDAPWRELDELVKEPGLKFNSRAADLLDRVADIQAIAPDGETLYISSRLRSDRFELCAFSLKEGVIKDTIAKHPKYDLTAEGRSSLLFAKNSSQLLGMTYDAKRPQVVWFDKRFAAAQAAMDAQFPKHVNWPIDWSVDGQTFIYFSSSDRDPGTYSVFLPAESRLIPLLPLGEQLQGKALAATTAFDFTARDGATIPAYLTMPPEASAGPLPLLVNIHGGPMVRDSWSFSATNQFFASRGYAVLEVNYRGSSGYGAAFQNAGLLQRLDTVVIDDIADGVRHLVSQGTVDPRRVVVMGASFGGWATYISLAKYPELYRAGIAISAVSHWRQTLRDDRSRFNNQVAYRFWDTLLKRGSFAEDEKFIDPLLRAAEIKQPVFIIHGERDDIVHATEAKVMLEALRKTNPHVRAKSFPEATHSSWSFADRVVLLNEIANFLGEHLGPSNQSPARAEQ